MWGTVEIQQDGRTVALEPGQVGLVSLRSAFRFRASAPNEGLGDLVQWRLPREVVTQRHPGCHTFKLRTIGDGTRGARLLAQLLVAFVQDGSSLTLHETAACFTTLVEAFGLLTPADEPSAEQQRVHRALQTIQRHLHDSELTPNVVTNDQAVSRRCLNELLKRHGHRSLSATIRNARLDRAAQSLRDKPGLKLLAVAISLGFVNQSHFARHFKERFGFSPSEFREEERLVPCPLTP